eukprot:Lankesteria_metandrocarpae@DN7346_c0_g1_i1.p1
MSVPVVQMSVPAVIDEMLQGRTRDGGELLALLRSIQRRVRAVEDRFHDAAVHATEKEKSEAARFVRMVKGVARLWAWRSSQALSDKRAQSNSLCPKPVQALQQVAVPSPKLLTSGAIASIIATVIMDHSAVPMSINASGLPAVTVHSTEEGASADKRTAMATTRLAIEAKAKLKVQAMKVELEVQKKYLAMKTVELYALTERSAAMQLDKLVAFRCCQLDLYHRLASLQTSDHNSQHTPHVQPYSAGVAQHPLIPNLKYSAAANMRGEVVAVSSSCLSTPAKYSSRTHSESAGRQQMLTGAVKDYPSALLRNSYYSTTTGSNPLIANATATYDYSVFNTLSSRRGGRPSWALYGPTNPNSSSRNAYCQPSNTTGTAHVINGKLNNRTAHGDSTGMMYRSSPKQLTLDLVESMGDVGRSLDDYSAVHRCAAIKLLHSMASPRECDALASTTPHTAKLPLCRPLSTAQQQPSTPILRRSPPLHETTTPTRASNVSHELVSVDASAVLLTPTPCPVLRKAKN